MLDRLAAVPPDLGLVHDLRNLLQTATAAISIIERGTSDRPKHVDDAIAGARASIERASALAVQGFEQKVRSRPASLTSNLATELGEVASILRHARPSIVEVDVHVETGLGPLRCDPSGLQNALLNLGFNAIEAIADDGRVAIRARRGGRPRTIEIEVSDDGVGMSPDTVARAFDPFFTTKCEGLGGVGLATVEDFVSRSGGEIRIESELGAGTSIRMLLPEA